MMWARNPIFNTWGSEIARDRRTARQPARDAPCSSRPTPAGRAASLPIMKSGIYFGEIYDARAGERSTADSGSDGRSRFDTGAALPHEIDAVSELQPLRRRAQPGSDAEGRTVYDFGQNIGGYVAFTVEGRSAAPRSSSSTPRSLDQRRQFRQRATIRTAEARIEYILKGGGRGELRADLHLLGLPLCPRDHRGQGRDHRDRARSRSARHMQPTGAFTSAHRWSTGWSRTRIWSQRSNFIEVPTDCPQRDERSGWTGDAQVFAPTACYLHDSHDFLRK